MYGHRKVPMWKSISETQRQKKSCSITDVSKVPRCRFSSYFGLFCPLLPPWIEMSALTPDLNSSKNSRFRAPAGLQIRRSNFPQRSTFRGKWRTSSRSMPPYSAHAAFWLLIYFSNTAQGASARIHKRNPRHAPFWVSQRKSIASLIVARRAPLH